MGNGGYLKLWRKSLESDVWKNANVWRVWTYLLLRARYRPSEELKGYQYVKLEPGQLIFGRKQAAIDTGLSEQTIRSALSLLKEAQSINQQTTNKFSVISIVNWELYQGEGDDDQPADQPTNNQQITSKQPAEQPHGVRRVKKGEEGEEGKKAPLPPGSGSKTPACPYVEIVGLYHEILPMLQGVRVLGEPLKKDIQARWREDKDRQTLDWWRGLFEDISHNKFLTGRKKTGAPWRATLGWIVKASNMLKILNGNFPPDDDKEDRDLMGRRTQVNINAMEKAQQLLDLDHIYDNPDPKDYLKDARGVQ